MRYEIEDIYLTNIANSIRRGLDYDGGVHLEAAPDMIDGVYSKGCEDGYNDGWNNGYTSGKADGGTLPTCFAEINGGSWTQATTMGDGTSLDIEHGLSDLPDVIVISSDVFEIEPTTYNMAYMFYEKPTNTTSFGVYYNQTISTRGAYELGKASVGITNFDNTKFTITPANNRKLGVGITYNWTALRWNK